MKETARRLLPPMGALQSFVAAAAYGSFSRAADDVGLTQSAVSRQIAVLEDWLQMSLFVRNGRRVELTRGGRAYADAISPALDRIRSATTIAMSRRPERELNIATLPSFGMRWLAPRLVKLTTHYPDMIVNFGTRSFEFDFANDPFDAAIHFGHADRADLEYDLLFREEAVPVCSPKRLAEQPIERPADVLDWPLLVQSSRKDAWKLWLAAAGVDETVPSATASFEHFMMLAQAAAAGSGIALIPRFLIENELADRSLVVPLSVPLRSDEAYYLVYPKQPSVRSALSEFRDWLLQEARGQLTA